MGWLNGTGGNNLIAFQNLQTNQMGTSSSRFDFNFTLYAAPPTTVPEPSTLALLLPVPLIGVARRWQASNLRKASSHRR
jgi:hypothetical protein